MLLFDLCWMGVELFSGRNYNGTRVKVTVDATIFKDQETFGVGLISRNDVSGLVQMKSELFYGMVDPEVAEIIVIEKL